MVERTKSRTAVDISLNVHDMERLRESQRGQGITFGTYYVTKRRNDILQRRNVHAMSWKYYGMGNI